MADVTISGLDSGIPNKNSAIIPYSDGTTTLKTSPSGIVAASPGAVLQVKQLVSEARQTTTSIIYSDLTGYSISITPTSTSSKILVSVDAFIGGSSVAASWNRIVRNFNSIDTVLGIYPAYLATNSTSYNLIPISMRYLDSNLNTTNQVTYRLQHRTDVSGQTICFGSPINNAYTQGTVNCTNTITLMEIAG